MSFWKIFFGSLLGFVVGIVLITILFVFVVAGIVAGLSSDETATVKTNSILSLDLDYDISEQTTYKPVSIFSFSDFEPTENPGLYEIVKNIRKAKDDADIKGTPSTT